MPNIGPMELAIVLVIALVILGPKKLPEMGRSVGRGMREFKQSVTGNDEPETETKAVTTSATTTPASAIDADVVADGGK